MTICRTIVAGLLGLLTALAMTPAAYAGDARTFFGVVDDPLYEEIGAYATTGQSNTFFLNGTLPPGTTIYQFSEGGLDMIYLDGSPSQAGVYNFSLIWYEGDTSNTLGNYEVTVTVYGLPSVSVTADKWTCEVGEVARLYAHPSGGSGNYSFHWYKLDENHQPQEIGSDLNMLPYPTSGALTLDDDGATFVVEVCDTVTGYSCTSGQNQIAVICTHDFSAWTEESPATCTEPQKLVRTCSKCGYEETMEGDPATGHTLSEWYELSASTCTAAQVLARSCEDCDYTELKEGDPATGHSYGAWGEKSAPTCTEAQVLVHVCTACGAQETKTGNPAKGHTWGTWLQHDAETMVHTCQVCGAQETQAIVAGTPFINTQPVGGEVLHGETLTLTVEASPTGLGDLTYQWLRSDTKGGKATAPLGPSTGTSFVADTEGYYFVRVTQTAGGMSNSVDSDIVYVHVHALGDWVVDKDAGTVTRSCTGEDCTYEESYTIAEFRAAYPTIAKELGIASSFDLGKVLRWVLGGLLALVVVAAIVIIILLVRRRAAAAKPRGGAHIRR